MPTNNRLYDSESIADNPYQLPVDAPQFDTQPREPVAREPLRFTIHPDNMMPGSGDGAGYKLTPVDYDPWAESQTHKADTRKTLPQVYEESGPLGKAAMFAAGLPYGLAKNLIVDPIKGAANLTNRTLGGEFVGNDMASDRSLSSDVYRNEAGDTGKALGAAALAGTGGLAGVGPGGVSLGSTITKAQKVKIKENLYKLEKETNEAEMKGEELPQSKYDEYNEAMRQYWALKQGFDTESFHGTALPFRGNAVQTFDSKKPPELQGQFYSSDKPNLANEYSLSHLSDSELVRYGINPNESHRQILPLRLDTREYHEVDAKGAYWDDINQKAIREAKEKGMKGVTIKNVIDNPDIIPGEPSTIHITFDPSTVRSQFAKFNPQNVGKSGLMLSDTSEAGQVVQAIEKMIGNKKYIFTPVKHNPFGNDNLVPKNSAYENAVIDQWFENELKKNFGTSSKALNAESKLKFTPVEGDPFEKK